MMLGNYTDALISLMDLRAELQEEISNNFESLLLGLSKEIKSRHLDVLECLNDPDHKQLYRTHNLTLTDLFLPK